MQISRRFLVSGGTAAVALVAAAVFLRPVGGSRAAEGKFEVSFTEAEWKAKLSPEAFEVLRHEDTEYPGTSPLLNEHRAGTFDCAGCALPLFDSATKYDSGTGWPSFYQPLENAVEQSTDSKLGYVRNEVHCRRCGGHLGHVFDDGPQPTGLRYCMNGVALSFTPA
ncbi:peptide-methionine (R)-S-oxide reductase MsrB [Devosia sp.]|uniref:peptide-methionine (R)-S-oxide reductase MsrB n=1 Tax=Devosia sp. TaxID=1871048 RepID=UPI003BABA948